MEEITGNCDGYTVNVIMLIGLHNVQNDDNIKNISFNNYK